MERPVNNAKTNNRRGHSSRFMWAGSILVILAALLTVFGYEGIIEGGLTIKVVTGVFALLGAVLLAISLDQLHWSRD